MTSKAQPDHHSVTREECEAPRSTLEEMWLLGQPPLQDYLDFMRHTAVVDVDRRTLCDEWRAANDYYHELETNEAGIADEAEFGDLDPELAPLVEELTNDPRFRRAFDTLPTSFGMVELDRLVVYQPHVTRQFVHELQSRLGPAPSQEALFRFCFPLGASDAPVRIRRIDSRRYAFSSVSSDFRFNEAAILRPEQIEDFTSFGPIGAVLGLVVGFGSNFLHATRADNRFVLQNGYHRACALRAAGCKYAPCIIETVTRRAELSVAASRTVVEEAAFYFKAARPPLLKDFFDPRICKVVPVRRMRKTIEVSFDIREFRLEE